MKRFTDIHVLVSSGCPLAQFMHTTMYIRTIETIETIHSVDDSVGFLRCGSVVQINEGLAMHLLIEGREVLSGRSDFKI
jgi:hypothetical protein